MDIDSEVIAIIQHKLKLEPTGVVDELTEAGIKNYQLKTELDPSGKLDMETVNMVLQNADISTDYAEIHEEEIHKYYLPNGEYNVGPTSKEYIFLHHTAGWNNPYRQVDIWAGDDRGRLGTQFVIGGINLKTDDDQYDGEIVECFKYNNYAWHLGTGNTKIHRNSVGIEICNFGQLTKKGNDFYTYTNQRVPVDQVVDLGFKFRGYQYWHKYTDRQIESVQFLIKKIGQDCKIDILKGLAERIYTMSSAAAFEYSSDILSGKYPGLYSHSNVRKDKFDVSPQPLLIDCIAGLK